MRTARERGSYDPTAPKGWGCHRLSDYTAHLSTSDYVQFRWSQGKVTVYVCGDDASAQLVPVSIADRAVSPWMFPSLRRAIGYPVICKQVQPGCCRTRGALRHRGSSTKKCK